MGLDTKTGIVAIWLYLRIGTIFFFQFHGMLSAVFWYSLLGHKYICCHLSLVLISTFTKAQRKSLYFLHIYMFEWILTFQTLKAIFLSDLLEYFITGLAQWPSG